MKKSTINFICYGVAIAATMVLVGVFFNKNILLSMLFAGLNVIAMQALIDDERETIESWINKIFDRLF